MSSANPVLISGAGLGGCSSPSPCAPHRIPFKLYERDGRWRIPGRRGIASGSRPTVSPALEQVLDRRALLSSLGRAAPTSARARSRRIDALTMLAKPLAPPGGAAGVSWGPPAGVDVVGVGPDVPPQGRSSRASKTRSPSGRRSWGTPCRKAGWWRDSRTERPARSDPSSPARTGCDRILTRQLTKGALKVYDTGARAIHGSSPSRRSRAWRRGCTRIRDEARGGGRIAMITNTMRKEQTACFGWVLVGSPGSFSAAVRRLLGHRKPAAGPLPAS